MRMLDDVSRLIVRELQSFDTELAMFPDEDAVWRTIPGLTNSAGNLALHVAGNLQHFVGAVLGGTGYVRDRDAEFSRRSGTREEIGQQLRAAQAAVVATLARLDASALAAPIGPLPNGLVVRTEIFLLHLVAHTAFHLGQAGYIRRVITGDPRSANPVPLAPLVDG